MGLLKDTISDAFRPVRGGADMLRRAAFEPESFAEDSGDATDNGSLTVYRFQKAGGEKPSLAPTRSASVGKLGMLGRDDPRVAHTDTPGDAPVRSPAGEFGAVLRVGDWLSGEDKLRAAEIDNGFVKDASVSASVVVSSSQGVVSGPSSSASVTVTSNSDEVATLLQDDSGRLALSRVTGRGAPSEIRSAVSARAAEELAALAGAGEVGAQPVGEAFALQSDAMMPSYVYDSNGEPIVPRRHSSAQSDRANKANGVGMPTMRASPARYAAQKAYTSEAPRVRIGRIEVTVLAPSTSEPAAPAAQATADSKFLSRNYLRRL